MLHHCYAASASPRGFGSGCRGFGLDAFGIGELDSFAIGRPFGHLRIGYLDAAFSNCEAVQFPEGKSNFPISARGGCPIPQSGLTS